MFASPGWGLLLEFSESENCHFLESDRAKNFQNVVKPKCKLFSAISSAPENYLSVETQ